ncbi:MAG: TolC family protein, partial [Pseudomonadota bacterium]
MNLYKAFCLLLPALLLTACAVGPDYKAPDPKVPKTWSEMPDKGVSASANEVIAWWETFSDPVLNSLVERAVQSNQDVRIAEARLREARAARDVTAADLWPNLNSSGSYARTHVNTKTSTTGSKSPAAASSTSPAQGQTQATAQAGTAGASKKPSSHVDLFKAGFDATWELDIFGGVRRSVEAAQANIGAAQEDHRAVIVSLLAEVALNYVELCGLQRRITITENNIATQKDTLEITQARYDAGLTSEIDVLKAQAEVAGTRAQIPALEALAKRSVHRLGVLLGKEPGALSAELSQHRALPAVPPDVPVDLPSALLRRRPDIRSAERRLAAATANIGVAVAE